MLQNGGHPHLDVSSIHLSWQVLGMQRMCDAASKLVPLCSAGHALLRDRDWVPGSAMSSWQALCHKKVSRSDNRYFCNGHALKLSRDARQLNGTPCLTHPTLKTSFWKFILQSVCKVICLGTQSPFQNYNRSSLTKGAEPSRFILGNSKSSYRRCNTC